MTAEAYRKRLFEEALALVGQSTNLNCSEFVFHLIHNVVGIPLTETEHTCRKTYEILDKVGEDVEPGDERPGDIVLFSYNGWRPQHIGIMGHGREYIDSFSPVKDGPRTIRLAKIKPRNIKYKPGPARIVQLHLQFYFRNPIAIKRLKPNLAPAS